MVRKQILLFVLIFFQSTIYAQYSFYDTDTVREVRIYFYDSNWENFGWEKKGILDKWDKYKKYNSLTPQCIWTYAVAGIWLNKN